MMMSPSVVLGVSPKTKEKWELSKNRRITYFVDKLVTEDNILDFGILLRKHINF